MEKSQKAEAVQELINQWDALQEKLSVAGLTIKLNDSAYHSISTKTELEEYLERVKSGSEYLKTSQTN